jgi:hypothetical protein
MSIGNFGLQSAQENRQQKAQNFAEKSAISNVALQFGLTAKEGETMDQIVSRAAPLASQKQQLEMAKLQAETNRANAEASKAFNDNKLPNLKDPLLLGASADLFRSNYADFVSKVKTTNEFSMVKQAAVEAEKNDTKDLTDSLIKSGITNPNDLYTQINTQLSNNKKPIIAPQEVMKIIEEKTKNLPAKVPEKSWYQKIKDESVIPKHGFVGKSLGF